MMTLQKNLRYTDGWRDLKILVPYSKRKPSTAIKEGYLMRPCMDGRCRSNVWICRRRPALGPGALEPNLCILQTKIKSDDNEQASDASHLIDGLGGPLKPSSSDIPQGSGEAGRRVLMASDV